MQTEELSYAIITPYSMRKSRTGGIIARLISRTGLDLVAARMFAPSEELVRRYAHTIVSETEPAHRATQELIHDYVLENFGAKKDRQQSRVLFLVFRGPDASERIRATVGHITHEETSGETIRDTFGDYVTDDSGKVIYFEPAVVAEFNRNAIERDLKLWAEFSDRDGGVLDQAVQFPKDAKIEKTLVLIKPDNFKFPNIRPGGVIEVFSRTGLYIVGFKVHRMSVAQAEDFYGPVLPVLQEKLGHNKGRDAWEDIVELRPADRPAIRFRKKGAKLARKNGLARVIKAETAFAKSARSFAQPDRQKRPPGRIEKD